MSVYGTSYVRVRDVRIFYLNSPKVAFLRRCCLTDVSSSNSGCAVMVQHLPVWRDVESNRTSTLGAQLVLERLRKLLFDELSRMALQSDER